MTEENKNSTPASPEVQPAEVRQELHQQNVTHQGHPTPVVEDNDDAQRHMGTVETDVTPIRAPTAGPADLIGNKEDNQEVENPQSEITPG